MVCLTVGLASNRRKSEWREATRADIIGVRHGMSKRVENGRRLPALRAAYP
jgi:hypothetical protein